MSTHIEYQGLTRQIIAGNKRKSGKWGEHKTDVTRAALVAVAEFVHCRCEDGILVLPHAGFSDDKTVVITVRTAGSIESAQEIGG